MNSNNKADGGRSNIKVVDVEVIIICSVEVVDGRSDQSSFSCSDEGFPWMSVKINLMSVESRDRSRW